MKPVFPAITLLMLAATTPAVLLAAPRVQPTADEEAAAVAWINSAGHRLTAAEPAMTELAPLATRLAGARVIGIGEATHGTHEDQAFKAALIRALVRAGAINVLALEANRAAGRNFDRYVRLGEGDPVALVLDSSFFRAWQDDEFASLLLWLRAWNLANPAKAVRMFGIDDQDAGRDVAFALAFVARHDAALAQSLRDPFADLIPAEGGAFPKANVWASQVKVDTFQTALAGAKALEEALEAHHHDWQIDPDYAEAWYAVRAARQMFFVFELDNAHADVSQMTPEYYSRRDRFMTDNLLSQLQADEHAVFWAHDGHVYNAPIGEPPKGGYTSVGSILKTRLGDAYRAVGFTWSQATLSTVKSAAAGSALVTGPRVEEPVTLPNDRAGELGSVFARASGDALWIDLMMRPHNENLDHWMHVPYLRGYAGWAVDPAKWQNGTDDDAPLPTDCGFDVLVWFRTMSPAHRLPVASSAPPS